MKKYLIVIVVIFAVLFFEGCCNPISPISKLLFEEQQGKLRVSYTKHCTDYIYDKKVHLVYAHGRREDYLCLHLEPAGGKEKIILKGDFQKVAFEEERLFVFSDNKYYILDMDSYVMPEFPTVTYTNEAGVEITEDVDIQYDLQECSSGMFEFLYPDNQSFEWISW